MPGHAELGVEAQDGANVPTGSAAAGTHPGLQVEVLDELVGQQLKMIRP